MVLELGPCPADEVTSWTRFARRVILELRTHDAGESGISPDVLSLWCNYIDRWAETASDAAAEHGPFRWSDDLDPDVGQFLLHGLDQCLHSDALAEVVTPAESSAHRGFTMKVVRAFVDALACEGEACEHYVDQVLISFGGQLDH